MTAPGILVRNVGYNLLGNVLPLLVAVAAIPLLIQGLGADRFGVLTLAWTAIGYFGLFDFGIGRSLTQVLSTALGAGHEHDAGTITWTALAVMFVLGSIGAIALAAAAPVLVVRALKIPESLRPEAIATFRLLAASLPLVVTTAGLRGVLEAHQDFGIATALRVPYAIFTFLGPLLVLPFTHRLDAVVGSLVIARVLLWAAHLAVVLRRYPSLRGRPSGGAAYLRPLLRTGGWMTVSNVVSPLMVNIDRFLIAGLIGTSAVAYYVTPYELANKLLIVPGALLGVLFPAFAASFVTDPLLTARRVDQALRAMIVVMFPLVLALVALAPEGLRLWVGAEFAGVGAPVLQWLAAGMLINAVGHVPFGALQGMGRSDITAKLHLLELPIYLLLLTLLARSYGITGVAIAWTLRVTIDTVALLVATRRFLPREYDPTHSLRVFAALVGLLGVVALIAGTMPRWGLAALIIAGFVPYGVTRLLRQEERAVLYRTLRRSDTPLAG